MSKVVMRLYRGPVEGRTVAFASTLPHATYIRGDEFVCAGCGLVLALASKEQIRDLVIKCSDCGGLNCL